MNKPDTQPAPQPTSTKAECCTETPCHSGCRNNYFEGKRLTADSFRVEQRYLIERRQLLNRAIHGWGVVYGFAISRGSSEKLTIGPGLALDECGRELLQCGPKKVRIEDLIVLDENAARSDLARTFSGGQSTGKPPECWLLSVHYAEQSSGPVTISDSCRCEHQEWEHTCETVRYSLRRVLCSECCCDSECGLTCECGTGKCCDEADPAGTTKNPTVMNPPAIQPVKRGGCRCLCEHLTRLNPNPECGPLCTIEEPCGHARVDLRHGVPLACITITPGECDRWALDSVVDACGPRRLVKRNDLLFDLIRGCDLTRISEIGWKDFHRKKEPVPFDEFSAALGPAGNHQDVYISRDFWVKFSGPVRNDTVRPDCFVMTVMSPEREGGWLLTFRVPIVDIQIAPPEPGDPPGHTRMATFVFDGAWTEDAFYGRRSIFIGSETRVEIEVRGDFIVDCNGQTVDANAVGLIPAPTGNGTPGDTFISTFSVAAARDRASYDKGASS